MEKNLNLQIWDTAGSERFQSLGTIFFRGTNLCILMFDITNKKSFDELNNWKNEFLECINCSDASEFPFVLVANKVCFSFLFRRR